MQTKNQTNLFRNTIFAIIAIFSVSQNFFAQAFTGSNTHFRYSLLVKDKKEFNLTIRSK